MAMAGVPTAERTAVPHRPTAEAQLTADALLGHRMAAGLRVMAGERMAGPRQRMEDGPHHMEAEEQRHPVVAGTRRQAAEVIAAVVITVAEDITKLSNTERR